MTGFLTLHAPLWPVLLPILGAGLAACLWKVSRPASGQRPVHNPAAGCFAAVARCGVSRGILAIRFGDWAAPFGIVFVADALAAAMVAITGILAAAVMTFGLADIRRREEQAGFHPAAGHARRRQRGLPHRRHLQPLCVVRGNADHRDGPPGDRPQPRAARCDGRYAILNLFSTLLFLTGVALLYGATGTLNMADLARVLPQTEPSINLTLPCAALRLGIKAGYFPLFFWLPASYHTASITVSAIFAGLLTKVGCTPAYACSP